MADSGLKILDRSTLIDWKRLLFRDIELTEPQVEFLRGVVFCLRHFDQKEYTIDDDEFEVIDTATITIPGSITDVQHALYRTPIDLKTLKLFIKKKPDHILYIYTGHKPHLSAGESNPSGFVELVFKRLLLRKVNYAKATE